MGTGLSYPGHGESFAGRLRDLGIGGGDDPGRAAGASGARAAGVAIDVARARQDDRRNRLHGSESGHQMAAFGRGAPRSDTPAANTSPDWTLNDEAIRNLGYMQMKKTHDAAMAVIERMYGERPRFNYFTGTSQGGREALTV